MKENQNGLQTVATQTAKKRSNPFGKLTNRLYELFDNKKIRYITLAVAIPILRYLGINLLSILPFDFLS